MSGTHTLTDRYVAAVTRRVPEKQRADIERELRAEIGDDADARAERGATPEEAEYAALAELGAPARLAARYAHRSPALVGPESFPDYVRALRGLCLTVLPVVYVVLALVDVAHGENVWVTVFRPLGTTLTVAMYLAVGVTALFAAVDRTVAGVREGGGAGDAWTPDQLPLIEVRGTVPGWSDVIGTGAKTALVIALLVAERWISPVGDAAGRPVPVIAPALWHGWVPYFLCLAVLGVVLQAVNARIGRWSPVNAVLGTVLTLAGAAPLAGLFWQARVFNHALSHGAGALAAQGSWVSWLGILFAALVTVARLTEAWRGRPDRVTGAYIPDRGPSRGLRSGGR
ncbi:permease prefix domain 1-containing protein [Streptomyces sp. DW26H14]|uniref:permease prefix domain 1-containing protein n=1 Tax=Streptomyces sp. DW26H14 TaxID=3435395 RepID=UPI00403DB493